MKQAPRLIRRSGGWQRRRRHPLLSGLLTLALVAALAGTVTLGGSGRVASAQGMPLATADVTPETALIYIAVNLDTSSAQYVKAGELLLRVGATASVPDLLESTGETMDAEDLELLEELEAFLGGEAAIVLTSFGLPDSSAISQIVGDLPVPTPAMDEAEPGFAIIVSVPDTATAWSKAEELLIEEAMDRGVTVTEETYEGVQIKSTPADEFTDESGTAIAQVDNFIVISDSARGIAPFIDTAVGNLPALANAAGFQRVTAELNKDFLLFGYVNGARFGEELADLAGTSGIDLSMVDLAEMEADTGFILWADDPGFRLDSITVPRPGATLPTTANFDAELPGRVPSDVLFFVDSYDLGASGALDALFLGLLGGLTGTTDDVATPPPGMSTEEFVEQQFQELEQMLGFNIKTDFIDQLVGEFGIAIWGLELDEFGNLAPEDLRVLVVSDAATPAILNDALSKVSLLIQAGLAGQGTVTTRLVGEDQISVLTIESMDGTPPITVEYGVVRGQFVLSVNDALADYLAGTAAPLSSNPAYQRAMSLLPAEHNAILYVDVASLARLVQEGMTAMESSFAFEVEDASEKCADYPTQEAAQAAFDADPGLNWELDLDFDGVACEDYFAPAALDDDADDELPVDLSAMQAWVTVAYERDGLIGSSSILLIEE